MRAAISARALVACATVALSRGRSATSACGRGAAGASAQDQGRGPLSTGLVHGFGLRARLTLSSIFEGVEMRPKLRPRMSGCPIDQRTR